MRIPRSWLVRRLTAGAVVAAVASIVVASPGAQGVARRTPWGDPDLQGTWVINDNTPLERPDPKVDAARLAAMTRWFPGGPTGFGGLAGVNEPVRIRKGGPTALVVDPPTGRIPMRPEAEARRDHNLTHLTDSYEYHTLWERCLTRGPVLLPSLYNNGYQILQTPGSVTFLHEMIHEYRIVPLDGRPRRNIPQWLGEPRGHWEGQTLVIETTNYRADTILASSIQSVALRGIPHSETLRTIERLTLKDDHTLNYELVVDDPHTYTSPWRVVFAINREDDYTMYEYACHEGNHGLPNSLSGARAEERGGR